MHVYSTLIGGLIASLTSAELCRKTGKNQCKKDNLCKWKKGAPKGTKGACTFKSEKKIRKILKARTESSYADGLTDGRGYSVTEAPTEPVTEAPTEPPTEPPTEDPECYEYSGHNCCPIPPEPPTPINCGPEHGGCQHFQEPCRNFCTYREGLPVGTKNCLFGGVTPKQAEDHFTWQAHSSYEDEDGNYRFMYTVFCETNTDCCGTYSSDGIFKPYTMDGLPWGPAVPCPTGKNEECCGWEFDYTDDAGVPIPCPF